MWWLFPSEEFKDKVEVAFVDVETNRGYICQEFIDLGSFEQCKIGRRYTESAVSPYRLIHIVADRAALPLLYSVAEIVDEEMFDRGYMEAYDYQLEFLS